MKKFDILAQLTIENRFVAERKEGETFEEAVLRQINEMSAAECKALFTSGELTTFHVENTHTNIIRLIVNDKLNPDDDKQFLESLAEKINKNMTVAEVAEIIAADVTKNAWNLLAPEECTGEAERILHLLHKVK